jgi:hypothetical protein
MPVQECTPSLYDRVGSLRVGLHDERDLFSDKNNAINYQFQLDTHIYP